MTTLTAEEIHLKRLMCQQVKTIQAAITRWKELNSQLIELRQQAEDSRPAMRLLLELQGAAAVAEAERVIAGVG